jgi:hypothetical protein
VISVRRLERSLLGLFGYGATPRIVLSSEEADATRAAEFPALQSVSKGLRTKHL